MMIEIEDDVKEYLDKILHNDGAEAWYTGQVRLDLTDYNGAIKSLANQLCFERMVHLSNDKKEITFDFPFDKGIRIDESRLT